MNKIIAYYTLCAVGNMKHPINNISNTDKGAFTKREIELYFRKKDGMYVPREDIIGAEEPFYDNEPLPWYLQKVGGRTYEHKCIVYC